MSQIKRYGLRVAAAIVACILWSLAFVFIKLGLQFMPPLQFAGLRFFISGLVLIPLVLYYLRRSGETELRGRIFHALPRLFLLGNLQIGIKYACFYFGVALLPAALSALISGTSPLVVALLAHFVTPDDKLDARKVVALLLGVFGVLLLTLLRNTVGAVGEWALLGIVLLILTNLFTGIGDILVRHQAKQLPSILIACSSLIVGGAVLLLAGWLVEGVTPLPDSPRFYGALFALCTISSGAFVLWFWVLQDPAVKVSRLHVWKFLIPLLGALTAWFFLPEEHPTLGALLGMSFIVLALFVLFWQKKKG
ncbi:MAG: DMT family transporter [Bacteroides sp.]